MKNLTGYVKFKSYGILEIFTCKNSQEERQFLFLCLGVRKQKKVVNRWCKGSIGELRQKWKFAIFVTNADKKDICF